MWGWSYVAQSTARFWDVNHKLIRFLGSDNTVCGRNQSTPGRGKIINCSPDRWSLYHGGFLLEIVRKLQTIMATTTSTIIVPTVVLTAPQLQPYNLRLEPDDNSLPFNSLSHLSLTSPGSIPGVGDDGISSYSSSATDLSNVDEYGARTTVYHIYHAGKRGKNFTAHSIKDAKLVKQLHEEIGPVVLKRGCGVSNYSSACGANAPNSLPPKEIEADDNKTDPRRAAYYLHSPFLWFHEPPQTLRFGADKNAPVVCLIEGSFFWRTWRLDFVVPEDGKKGGKKNKSKGQGQKASEMSQRVDSGFDEGGGEEVDPINKETGRRWKGLNEPGIIDPRGVLASQYPIRASGHRPGETGKEYVTGEVRRRRSSLIDPEQVASGINQSRSFSKRAREIFCPLSSSHLTAATPPPTPEPEILTELLSKPQNLPGHLRPDSLDEGSVLMKWSGWLTREYEFVYKGVDLRWKGTGTVKDEKKYFGSWSRYNHLKLVAILPDSDEEGLGEVEQKEGLHASDRKLARRASFSSFVSLLSHRDSGVSDTGSEKGKERPKGKDRRQVVIAKYTCLAARRKAGRLTVYEHGLEQATRMHVKSGDENGFNTEKERLRHLAVATALCMLQAEKEKRDTIIKTIEALLGGGSEAG